MHTSIGGKLFIAQLDHILKVDEPSTNAKKKRICVCIYSKFSVKSEASQKHIVKSRLFNASHLQIGRVSTYRQVLHLTISVCRKIQHKGYIRTI